MYTVLRVLNLNICIDGYGWLTNRGIKKATFCGLDLLNKYAADRSYFTGINDYTNKTQANETMEIFATINKNNTQISIFAFNWMSHGAPIQTQNVNIDIKFSNSNNLLIIKFN